MVHLNAILVSKCFLVVKFVVLGVDNIISFWTEAAFTPPADVRDGPTFPRNNSPCIQSR